MILPDPVVATLLDPLAVRGEIRRALATHANSQTGLSSPPSQFLRADGTVWHYHIKGAFNAAEAVAGIRISGFPGRGQTGLQMLVLTELASAAPLALVATATLAVFRVGGMVATTIEALRRRDARVMALIGAGQLAGGVVRAVQATAPFAEIRVAARTQDSAGRFCADLAASGIAGLEPAQDAQSACIGADVIVTLTDANAPIVQAEWCGLGSLLVTAGGGQECEPKAILQAERIFVDDWTQCTILGDIAALHAAGRIARTDIAGTIADVVAGYTVGRESQEQRIVAVPQGLTVIDLALALFAYRAGRDLALGQQVEWPLA